jgi:hypothetical protein
VELSHTESHKTLESVSSQIAESHETVSGASSFTVKPDTAPSQDSSVVEPADSGNQPVTDMSSTPSDRQQTDTDPEASGGDLSTDQTDGGQSPAKVKMEASTSDSGNISKIGRFQVTKAKDETSQYDKSGVKEKDELVPMKSPVKRATSREDTVSSPSNETASQKHPKVVSAGKEVSNTSPMRRVSLKDETTTKNGSEVSSDSETGKNVPPVPPSSRKNSRVHVVNATTAADTIHVPTVASTGAATPTHDTEGAMLVRGAGAAATHRAGVHSGVVPLPVTSNDAALLGRGASSVSYNV